VLEERNKTLESQLEKVELREKTREKVRINFYFNKLEILFSQKLEDKDKQLEEKDKQLAQFTSNLATLGKQLATLSDNSAKVSSSDEQIKKTPN
jgi:hypothetical protein